MLIGAKNTIFELGNSYIKDGLVNWWDGIYNVGLKNHDNASKTWNDLIGEVDIPVIGNSIFRENCCHIPATDKISCLVSSNRINLDAQSTIQIVFKALNQGNYASRPIAIRESMRGLELYWYNTNQFGCFVGDGYGYKELFSYTGGKKEINTASIVCDGRQSILYVNNEMLVSYDQTYNPYGNVILGDAYLKQGQRTIDEDVFSVRIYNRGLSQDELTYNEKVDKLRFGL